MFTGFFTDEKEHSQTFKTNTYSSTCEFLGMIIDYDAETGCAIIEQRNKFSIGDKVEFMKAGFVQTITEMYNGKGQPVDAAPHAQEQIRIKVSQPVVKFDIMRR